MKIKRVIKICINPNCRRYLKEVEYVWEPQDNKCPRCGHTYNWTKYMKTEVVEKKPHETDKKLQ